MRIYYTKSNQIATLFVCASLLAFFDCHQSLLCFSSEICTRILNGYRFDVFWGYEADNQHQGGSKWVRHADCRVGKGGLAPRMTVDV